MSGLIRRLGAPLVFVCAALTVGSTVHLGASASGVVISQVYGGGGNSGATYKNDFIELYNAGTTPVDVTGWSVQYGSSGGTSWTGKTALSGVIQPGHYYLVQEAQGAGGTVSLPTPDATGTIAMGATAGKVALVNNSTSLSGACPASAATVDLVGFGGANCFEGTGPTATLSNTTAALRLGNGATDSDNNSADFSTGSPAPRNASWVPPTTIGLTASPISGLAGEAVLLKVALTPGANPASTGLTVVGDLSAIGGSSAEAFLDDGMNGDEKGGDNIFSFVAQAPAAAGSFALPVTAADAQGRSTTATLQLTVATLTPIHGIQGSGTVSPYLGQSVTTRGIVTGVKSNGFFLQAPDAEADEDPSTSEGIFVYTGSNLPAGAVVYNRLLVAGTVSEFKSTSSDPDGVSMTELTAPVVTVLSTGNALPTSITLPAADLSPSASIFALEKYEGMRVHLDEVVSVSPTDGSVDEPAATSVSSGLFFAVMPGTLRPFREKGIQTPLPVPAEAKAGAEPPVFDANPERIGIDTYAVFLNPATAKVSPPPAGATLEVTTNVTVTGVTGPLDYAYRSYIIDTEGWNRPSAMTPSQALQPVRPRTSDEFTVATMNLARFFDTTDDAGSDVVLTTDAFAARLAKASMAIRNVLRSPDIMGVEEVENLKTLQAIAARVEADSAGALQYEAQLFEGNDPGGIDVGFLIRTDKVTVKSVEQYGKESMYTEPGGDSAILNDRPSLILKAAIQNLPYEPYPVTVVVNHLRSMSGIDTEDAKGTGPRVRAKRLAQAVELAGKLQALQAAGDHVISVGDYNAFEVNDGYVDVMGLLRGTEAPADRVALWAASPVTPPLFNLLDLAAADQRYSLLFDGNAQEVDHILASADVKPTAIQYARMNADFPESLRGDATRPERLSDHDPIVGYFSLPDIDTTAPDLTLPSPISMEGNVTGGAFVTYAASAVDAVDGNVTPACSPASGALFGVGQTTVTCTAVDAHGNRASGTFTVTVTDTAAPVIDRVAASPTVLWAPNHKPVAVTIQVSATDIVDASPACHITGVSGDDGASAGDWTLSGALALQLTAERQGKGSGRTYTIGVQCVDASKNVSATRSTTVFVPHDQRK